jgi:hypothetical protein
MPVANSPLLVLDFPRRIPTLRAREPSKYACQKREIAEAESCHAVLCCGRWLGSV